MAKTIHGSLFCIFILCSVLRTSSQTLNPDSSQLIHSVQHAVNFFNEVVGGNTHLYNGPEHRGYMRPAEGHPYYLTEDIQIGSLQYDGILYKNVPLMYDITKDNLITFQYAADSSIQYRSIFKIDLLRNRTGSFSLSGHNFIKVEVDGNSGKMKSGFYELLYNGRLKVLVRRSKVYKEDIKSELKRSYDSSSTYYILKEGVYQIIKNKNSILNIFKDKRRDLSAYISKNKLKYPKKKETFITSVTQYYDQLTN